MEKFKAKAINLLLAWHKESPLDRDLKYKDFDRLTELLDLEWDNEYSKSIEDIRNKADKLFSHDSDRHLGFIEGASWILNGDLDGK